MTFDLDESDRQAVILSLALCARLRPGWKEYCRDLASKLHGGSGQMFDELWAYNDNVKPVGIMAYKLATTLRKPPNRKPRKKK